MAILLAAPELDDFGCYSEGGCEMKRRAASLQRASYTIVVIG
jgi:hypothetical protein